MSEDVQWLNGEGQNYRTKSEKKVNSIENGGGIEYHQQYQTILNLYNSGIPTYIISLQLDMNEDDVRKIIQSTSNNTEPLLASPFSISLLENKFDNDNLTPSLENTDNMDIAIKNAQVRMWKALIGPMRSSELLQNQRSLWSHSILISSIRLNFQFPYH
ncbi:MAG TPA: hypothetical protein VD694_01955 [Nitrososphaeraceae archaeon]|nr:hypothetical protein [Nitrososphaeraceae archaeon]